MHRTDPGNIRPCGLKTEGKPPMAVAVDHSGFVEVEAHDARAALAELLNRRPAAMDKPGDHLPPPGAMGMPVQ